MINGLDRFLNSYIECALWSTNDESDEQGGEPLDKSYSRKNLSRDTLDKMRRECEKFLKENYEDIAGDFSQAGHDFWLTRNGHGAGFWDGDWPEEIGKRLTEASKKFGECWLSVSGGRIYQY